MSPQQPQHHQSPPSARSYNSPEPDARGLPRVHGPTEGDHAAESACMQGPARGAAHPLPPRPAWGPTMAGPSHTPKGSVSPRRGWTTRPQAHGPDARSRNRSRSPHRDDRSRRSGYDSYVPARRDRSRGPAHGPSEFRRERFDPRRPSESRRDSYTPGPYDRPPSRHAATYRPSEVVIPDTPQQSPTSTRANSQHSAPHPADGIIEDLLKQAPLPETRISAIVSPRGHRFDKRIDQECRVSDSYRPPPKLVYRQPLRESANYSTWDKKKLFDEVNVRRLNYEYEHPAYLAEILHINDRKFSERWDEIKHMNVKELLEEAAAWNIAVDPHVSSKHGPLLAEIAAPMARDAVTNHNALQRAMQVAQAQAEAQVAAKAKRPSKASRLAYEAAKADATKQKNNSPTKEYGTKLKSTQSRYEDSGYSTANAKPSTSPSVRGGSDDDEGPVNRATERVAAHHNSQHDEHKPDATELKAGQEQGKKRVRSNKVDDLDAKPAKKVQAISKGETTPGTNKSSQVPLTSQSDVPASKIDVDSKLSSPESRPETSNDNAQSHQAAKPAAEKVAQQEPKATSAPIANKDISAAAPKKTTKRKSASGENGEDLNEGPAKKQKLAGRKLKAALPAKKLKVAKKPGPGSSIITTPDKSPVHHPKHATNAVVVVNSKAKVAPGLKDCPGLSYLKLV